MKNKFYFFGIIAMVAIIGFSVAACGDGGGDGGGGFIGDKLNGTWIKDDDTTLSVTFTITEYSSMWNTIGYSFVKTGEGWFNSSGSLDIEGNLLTSDFGWHISFRVAINGNKLTISEYDSGDDDPSTFNGTYTKQP